MDLTILEGRCHSELCHRQGRGQLHHLTKASASTRVRIRFNKKLMSQLRCRRDQLSCQRLLRGLSDGRHDLSGDNFHESKSMNAKTEIVDTLLVELLCCAVVDWIPFQMSEVLFCSDTWFSELVLMCSKLQLFECYFHCAFCTAGFLHTCMMQMHSLCLQHHPHHDCSFFNAAQ